MRTPWGAAQDVTEIGGGIKIVSTASHGGIKVPAALNDQVHKAWRRGNGWYEEDCEALIVILTFPGIFKAHNPGIDMDGVHAGAKNWYPDEYGEVFEVTVTAAESSVRSGQEFKAANATNWVVVSAYGSWHEAVPEGMVGVMAVLGGHPYYEHDERRHFLVPEDEYDARGEHGFVIDPERHQAWDTTPASKRLG